MRKNCDRRTGFTLIELLVVMAIIGILASLAVAFVPRAQEQERSANAASQLQGWLAVAKQWALRDKAPRGVRLVVGANNLVTQLLYIEQPDDFFGGTVSLSYNTKPKTYSATGSGIDFTGGFTTVSEQPVQVGNFLEISGANQLFKITSVSKTTLGLTSPTLLPTGVTLTFSATADYRIIRQAVPRVGEAPLEMPSSVAIDLSTNQTYGNTLPAPVNGSIDILFSPAGPLVGWTGTGDMIQLWLRDTSNDTASGNNAMNGVPILVTIYVRTGMIAADPVDTTPGNSNPYGVTQTGGPSGL